MAIFTFIVDEMRWGKGSVFVSKQDLAETIGRTMSPVKRACRNLKALGLLCDFTYPNARQQKLANEFTVPAMLIELGPEKCDDLGSGKSELGPKKTPDLGPKKAHQPVNPIPCETESPIPPKGARKRRFALEEARQEISTRSDRHRVIAEKMLPILFALKPPRGCDLKQRLELIVARLASTKVAVRDDSKASTWPPSVQFEQVTARELAELADSSEFRSLVEWREFKDKGGNVEKRFPRTEWPEPAVFDHVSVLVGRRKASTFVAPPTTASGTYEWPEEIGRGCEVDDSHEN